ncbi:hypothetical protein B0H63DRAFT_195159 [Podospora didyma]|uniref:Uncharacterized protein n=1 Tax=Podospora didyma TaxID=330526 RepID=A0AAE0TVB8_9PEZI|nr:hypothetical protein B0H63DRAFT_195159 [Podospora didyma]
MYATFTAQIFPIRTLRSAVVSAMRTPDGSPHAFRQHRGFSIHIAIAAKDLCSASKTSISECDTPVPRVPPSFPHQVVRSYPDRAFKDDACVKFCQSQQGCGKVQTFVNGCWSCCDRWASSESFRQWCDSSPGITLREKSAGRCSRGGAFQTNGHIGVLPSPFFVMNAGEVFYLCRFCPCLQLKLAGGCGELREHAQRMK